MISVNLMLKFRDYDKCKFYIKVYRQFVEIMYL